ncbi:MAG: hypothetical protein HY243_17650 [Proteobacteria bacterium]|nr:hypothetical protein [Pseudomonadota bacterium]
MRRLWLSSLFTVLGAGLGMLSASDNTLTAGFVGALIGLIASVVVFSFPRDRDYPSHSDDFFSKN